LLLNDREAQEKKPGMMMIGCDFHPSFQQIGYAEQETGEYGERRLSHREEATAFYRSLAGRAVRIGLEATGNDRWFHKLMSEPGHELPVGGRLRDSCFGTARAADGQAGCRADFEIAGGEPGSSHLAALGGQPGTAVFLLHRCRLVRLRTRIKNQSDSIAMNEALTGSRTWSG
jgi:transposase